jgi:hypothetical protein
MLPSLLFLSLSTDSCSNLTYSLIGPDLHITGIGQITANCTAPFKSNFTGRLLIDDGVTSIGPSSFAEWPSIVSASLPSSLTAIGREAFRSASLGRISFPPTLRLIATEAFGNTTFDSATIRIPSLTTIFADSFIFASGVLRFDVDPEHLKYASDAVGCLYNKSFGIIYQYPISAKFASFKMPETVEYLAHDGVFANAKSLISIDLRDCLIETLQELTFFGCVNLVTVVLPRVLRAIRPVCFLFTGITAIEIPPRVSWIEGGTFAGSQRLREITVDPENEHFVVVDGILYDANLSVLYCAPPARKYGVIAVKDGVREIAEAALQSVEAEGIVLPDSVAVIGDYAMGRFAPEEAPAVAGKAAIGTKAGWISIGPGIEEVAENAFGGAEFGRVHWRGKNPPPDPLCQQLKNVGQLRITVASDSELSEVCGVSVERAPDPAEDTQVADSL